MSEILLESHEKRIARLEKAMSEANETLHAVRAEIAETKKLTQKVDTEITDLVSLMKGGQVAGKVLKWISIVSIGAGTAWFSLKEFIKYIGRA